MLSKRSHEGYISIDHRESPGVPDEIMVRQGLPEGSGRKFFESATITCSHCETVVVLNPDRSRERGYCYKCDHYICDRCETARAASGGICYPFKAMLQDILEGIDKGIAAPTELDIGFIKPPHAEARVASSEVSQSPLIT